MSVIHPRVNLHQVAFMDESTESFIEHCRTTGVQNMTLVTPKLMQPGEVDDARQALAAGGTRAAVVNHPLAMGSNLELDRGEASASLIEAIGIAAAVGAPHIYLVSGGRGHLSWDEAAAKFAQVVAPCLAPARENGVTLLVETAGSLNVDMHLAHTLDDTIRLAEIAGIGVCIELHACWFEGGLREKFARAMPLTGLVQVSDYVSGDRSTPCRAVPGDGMIPLESLLGVILELGYAGVFDLELVGPRIVAEGARAASIRAVERLSEILVKLGA